MLFDYWKNYQIIKLGQPVVKEPIIKFVDTESAKKLPQGDMLFSGDFLERYFCLEEGQVVLYVGLGKSDELSLHKIKEVVAQGAKGMADKKCYAFALELTPFYQRYGKEAIYQSVLGSYLGLYQFSAKAETEATLEALGKSEVTFSVAADEDLSGIVEEGTQVALGIVFARDITNLPGNWLRPQDLAEKIQALLSDTPVQIEILTLPELQKLKMGALLGVGIGSNYPPLMVCLRYQGADLYNKGVSEKHVALIGKGVTYDSGGYSLKPSDLMIDMNGDMGGAATVVGAVYALAKNQVPVNLSAFIPICENRIGPDSLSPSDVITSYSGKTIEVLNTDAEGRLIMCDAIGYGVKNSPATHVIDVATLTGAVVAALGHSVTGVVGNNDEFWKSLEGAAQKSGETFWRFPTTAEHRKMLESEVADIKNIGGKICGAITAGLFLEAFTENKPWLHLDIAGSGSVKEPIYGYQTKGATGAGLETLYLLLKDFG